MLEVQTRGELANEFREEELQELLDDLLDSAKIEAGKLELEAAPFSLRRMFDQVDVLRLADAAQRRLRRVLFAESAFG